MCTIRRSLFVIGAFGCVFGVVMTIYGFIMKSFWSDTNFTTCQLCNEQNKEIMISIWVCQVAGPICFGLGFIMVIVGVRLRPRAHKDKVERRSVEVFECESVPSSSNTQLNPRPQFNDDTNVDEKIEVLHTSNGFLQDDKQTQFQYNFAYHHSAFTDPSFSLENAGNFAT